MMIHGVRKVDKAAGSGSNDRNVKADNDYPDFNNMSPEEQIAFAMQQPNIDSDFAMSDKIDKTKDDSPNIINMTEEEQIAIAIER